MAFRPAVAVPWMTALLAADAAYLSAKRKVEQIESGRLPAGTTVAITAAEANAYAYQTVREEAPEGVRNPKLTFAAGAVTGSALIDFVKLQTSRGQPPGMLLAMLLRGERPVSVSVRVKSAAGKCQVDIEQVSVSNIPVSGRALDLLIEYYLLPRYPDVVIGKPFDLRNRVESITLTPRGADVRIGT